MANSPQARKRARQAEDRRQRNMAQRSTLRTFIKKVIKAIRADGTYDKIAKKYFDFDPYGK